MTSDLIKVATPARSQAEKLLHQPQASRSHSTTPFPLCLTEMARAARGSTRPFRISYEDEGAREVRLRALLTPAVLLAPQDNMQGGLAGRYWIGKTKLKVSAARDRLRY